MKGACSDIILAYFIFMNFPSLCTAAKETTAVNSKWFSAIAINEVKFSYREKLHVGQ